MQDFLNNYFQADHQIVQLAGDGSNRKIFRIFCKEKTFILVASNNRKDNQKFLCLSKALIQKGICVPTIYGVNKENTLYLQSDLGEKNFAEILASKEFSDKQILQFYFCIISDLEKLHCQKEVLKECNIYQQLPHLFTEHITYFQKYFLDYFSKLQKYNQLLQSELSLLVEILNSYCKKNKKGLVTRDFQARNIFIFQKKPYFIDYQDSCEGHFFYDLASLLFASSSGLTKNMRKQLIANVSQSYFSKEEDLFVFFCFVLIRRLRSLGTYTKLGIIEKKKNFQNHFQTTFQELLFIDKNYSVYQKFPKIIKMFVNFSQNNCFS